MKILRLGSSDDVGGRVAADAMAYRIVEQELTRVTGLEFTTVVRRIWPTPALPGLVARWIDEEAPDIVFVKSAPAFWFTYESVPLKVRRKLGVLGEPLAEFGVRTSRNQWLVKNRAYHAARRLAQRMVGGDTNFTPEEVITVMSEVLAIAARREEAVVVSTLPQGRVRHAVTAAGERRAEARRVQVETALSGVMDRLHIEHTEPRPAARYQTGTSTPVGRDQLHSDEEGQRRRAAEEVELMLRGLRRASVVPPGVE